MASNAGIVTGKQYIRFAETIEVGTGEVYEFRPVFFNSATPAYEGLPGALTDAVGVSQSFIAALADEPVASRLATVATSGLLLVEADSAVAAAIAVGSQLRVDAVGRAIAAGGTLTTIGGKVPYVREVIVGQRSFVLIAI